MAEFPTISTIRIGQQGKNVKAVQHLLIYRGYSISADGIFGGNTQNAVASFQASRGLIQTGEANQDTIYWLVDTVTSRTVNQAAYAAQTLLSKFESLLVDGDFYTGSQTATVNFQTRMGLSVTGAVDEYTWLFLFGYDNYPNSSGGASGEVGNNHDYLGNSVLTVDEIDLLTYNMSFYEKAEAKYNVPWRILAAIHYRENRLKRSGPSNGNGPYQIWGSSYKVGTYTNDEFQDATNKAAIFIMNDKGGNNMDLTNDDNIKRIFFKYNGTAQAYKNQAISLGFTSAQAENGEGSPYVMNRYDAIRDPSVAPTSTNRTWGQIKTDGGSLSYPANLDYGAYVVYRALM